MKRVIKRICRGVLIVLVFAFAFEATWLASKACRRESLYRALGLVVAPVVYAQEGGCDGGQEGCDWPECNCQYGGSYIEWDCSWWPWEPGNCRGIYDGVQCRNTSSGCGFWDDQHCNALCQ